MVKKNLKIKDVDIGILNDGKIKQSSFRQYRSTFNSLCRVVGDHKLKDLLKIKSTLEGMDLTKPKMRNWIMLIYWLYKRTYGEDDKSQKISDYLDKLISEIKDNGNKNDCSKEDIKRFKEIKQKVKHEISRATPDIKLIDLITLYMYTNVVTRRADSRFMRVLHNNKRKSPYPYINTKTSMMYFPPYKTKREVLINIADHPHFLDKVKQVDKNGEKLYKDSMSSDRSLNAMRNSQKAYSLYIKRIFKKHYGFDVNIQKLRRLDACQDIDPAMMKKIKERAYLQSHSVGEHVNTYMRMKK